MKLSKQDMKDIFLGATLFGTGGGGSYESALALLPKIRKVNLEDPVEGKYYVSHFGIGAVGDTGKPVSPRKILELYMAVSGKKIQGVIGGEIGAYILALNMLFCSQIGVPLIDRDAGGGRSIPTMIADIYTPLELSRLPLVAMSGKGNTLSLTNVDAEEMDCVLDEFYLKEKSPITVLGYGVSAKDLEEFPKNTISRCLKVGKAIRLGQPIPYFAQIGTMKVEKVDKTIGRFTKVEISGSGFRLLALNEFVKLEKSGKQIESMPNLIALTDGKKGLMSDEVRVGMELDILFSVVDSPMDNPEFSKKYLSPQAFGFR